MKTLIHTLLLLLVCGLVLADDLNIPSLPDGGSLQSTDKIPVSRNGLRRRVVTSAPVLSGTSASIGGGALIAGACASGTATVTGATTAMTAAASPNTYPGDGATWSAQVTSANTVTVRVCAIIALTPTASTYNVRVLQ